MRDDEPERECGEESRRPSRAALCEKLESSLHLALSSAKVTIAAMPLRAGVIVARDDSEDKIELHLYHSIV